MIMETENRKFHISKILMGEPYVIHQPDDIMIPATNVRVIVENGGMYQRTFLSFGLNDQLIRNAWDQEHEKFLKVDPHHLHSQATPCFLPA